MIKYWFTLILIVLCIFTIVSMNNMESLRFSLLSWMGCAIYISYLNDKKDMERAK
jgi:uncharacterized integral membrane protein